MTLTKSKSSSFAVGAKETTKAINNGRVKQVYIACDCDECVVQSIVTLCKKENIPIDYSFSKEELGKKARIKVGAATLGVFR